MQKGLRALQKLSYAHLFLYTPCTPHSEPPPDAPSKWTTHIGPPELHWSLFLHPSEWIVPLDRWVNLGSGETCRLLMKGFG